MANRQEDPIYEEEQRVEEDELNTQIDLNGCEFIDSDNEQQDLFFENFDGKTEVEVNQWLHDNQLGGAKSRGMRNNRCVCDGQMQSDYDDGEELTSPDGSNNENQQIERSNNEFNEKTDFKRSINLEIGMKFANFKVYRQALKQYAIENGIEFKYIKNEASRIRVKCKHNCGWVIHASRTHGGDAFQIKSFHQKEHNCGWERENKWVSASWLSNRYIEHIRDQPNWSVTSFSNQVRRDYNVEISKFQAYRAKRMALEVIEGRDAEQFAKIYAYCGAIIKLNPGSTMRVKAQGSRFKRLYMCLDACKQGFVAACRPIKCVDGCFLKGSFGGHLLSAVGKDANENMYPIAYAIVESECKDSWNWFMALLFEDIGSCQDKRWVMMSDMQKGLQEVLKAMECEHRFCVRHLYANFKLKYKGKNLKDEFWNACGAKTKQEFNHHMKRLKDLDSNAVSWLDKYDPRLWSKHAFSTYARCDIVQNNIAETFNSFILAARDKPIITMSEMIRRMLMKRIVVKREGMERSHNEICPRIMDKLQRAKNDSKNYICYMTGDGRFELESPWKREVVDLKMMTCTCKAWDLTGIPCGHVVAAIYRMRGVPEDYVSSYYSKNSFMRAYALVIDAVPSEEHWPQSTMTPLQPPKYNRAPGMPKKARKKAPDEQQNLSKISKKGATTKCGNCGKMGHNARGCKAPPNPNKKVYKKKEDEDVTSSQTEHTLDSQPPNTQGSSSYLPSIPMVSQPPPSQVLSDK